MNKPLSLFVGRSASGKTTIAQILSEQHGMKQVNSYTTRQPRFDGEIGHIFVNEEQFKSLGELAAYTYYNGSHYGTTFEQLNESDIYVVDVPGVKSLLKKLKDDDRPIDIFYFDASVSARILRMIERGDSDTAIISRLLQDEKEDWYEQLDSLVWKYVNLIGKDVELYKINADKDIQKVLRLVLYFMNQYKED